MTHENLMSVADATDAKTSTELPFLFATGMMVQSSASNLSQLRQIGLRPAIQP